MQTQSDNRFAKIEAEISSFISAVDQRFGEYERDIPMFNGETGDVESFIDRLKGFFGSHQKYYQTEPTAMLYFIEDHLQGTAKKWYRWMKYSNKGMTRN